MTNNNGTVSPTAGITTDVKYWRGSPTTLGTEWPTTAPDETVAFWQRAVERSQTTGDTVPLERVIERIDEQE